MLIFKKKWNINSVRNFLVSQFILEWKQSLLQKPKLRTYIKFKQEFKNDDHVMRTLSRSRRSLMAQFSLRLLPLEIETGRYAPIYDIDVEKNRKRYPSERVCKLYNTAECEDTFYVCMSFI